jgi:hypothetical protein
MSLSSSKTPMYTDYYFNRAEIERIVKSVRLNLYNQGLFCGPKAIRTALEQKHIQPLPSISTIKRILNRHSLTHARAGHYP